jgi:hypothetical protein
MCGLTLRRLLTATWKLNPRAPRYDCCHVGKTPRLNLKVERLQIHRFACLVLTGISRHAPGPGSSPEFPNPRQVGAIITTLHSPSEPPSEWRHLRRSLHFGDG